MGIYGDICGYMGIYGEYMEMYGKYNRGIYIYMIHWNILYMGNI
jgi:hypothetical protein